MAVGAVIKDGQIANAESAMSKDKKSGSSNVDKEQFMTLLVAQMKYQDPLEPTSNTEYISQYATFSELEQMQNMSRSLELSRASDLVGKLVVISPTDENGLTHDLEGQVDKVYYSNNQAYIEVDGRTFSAGDVSQVMSTDYADAKRLVEAWGQEIDKLPNINDLTLEKADAINTLYAAYNAFSDATKEMIDPAYVTAMKQYKARIDELQEAQAENLASLAQEALNSIDPAELIGEETGEEETGADETAANETEAAEASEA